MTSERAERLLERGFCLSAHQPSHFVPVGSDEQIGGQADHAILIDEVLVLRLGYIEDLHLQAFSVALVGELIEDGSHLNAN